MSIVKALRQSYVDKERKGFDKLYYFVDLHSTCIVPNYSKESIPTEFYPMAKEALALMSEREDICLVMYTCSHPHEVQEYLTYFKDNGINFEYVNENPEVKTNINGYGNYDTKPYFNVLFDDKCGFDGLSDWHQVYSFFKLELTDEA